MTILVGSTSVFCLGGVGGAVLCGAVRRGAVVETMRRMKDEGQSKVKKGGKGVLYMGARLLCVSPHSAFLKKEYKTNCDM